MTRLCAVEDIADGGAAEFMATLDGQKSLVFAVRKGAEVHAYLNWCPHQGRPLNAGPGKFLMRDTDEIFCAFHFACFRIEDGFCTDGPCVNQWLGRVPVAIEAGEVYIGDTVDWSAPR